MGGTSLGDLLDCHQISAHQRLCPTIPLCLLLETLDGITDLGVIVATRAVLLPQHPPPRRLLKKPASCGRMEQRH